MTSMRTFHLIVLLFVVSVANSQHDPDQNPYWKRYTFVEDSSELIPLKGDYSVYHVSGGVWWNYQAPSPVVGALPESGIRLLPLFDQGVNAFRATPARGIDFPKEQLVVIRDRDTMVVELSYYAPSSGLDITARCERMNCDRRPPVVILFRPGWYLANGLPYGTELDNNVDERTLALTQAFDRLWEQASKEERIVPQLNTDTCRQELQVQADIDRPETLVHDAWVLRSPYCGTHFLSFPGWGTGTTYLITFIPAVADEMKDPVSVGFAGSTDPQQWVDVSDWPVGDHVVRLVACGNGGSFTMKLR